MLSTSSVSLGPPLSSSPQEASVTKLPMSWQPCAASRSGWLETVALDASLSSQLG